MIGLDLSETESVKIAGAEFVIGLLPLAKFEEFDDATEEAERPRRAHRKTHTEEPFVVCDTCVELLDTAWRKLRPTYREVVRWGLRRAPDGLPLEMEAAQLAGKSYPVVSGNAIDRMSRVKGGALVREIALAVLAANRLSEEEVLGFK